MATPDIGGAYVQKSCCGDDSTGTGLPDGVCDPDCVDALNAAVASAKTEVNGNITTAVTAAKTELNAAITAVNNKVADIGVKNADGSVTINPGGGIIKTGPPTAASEVTLNHDTGFLQVGPTGSDNLGLDGNEIQARIKGNGAGVLHLNPHNGLVQFGETDSGGATLTPGSGAVQIGPNDAVNMGIYRNNVQTRTATGEASIYFINPFGGVVNIGNGAPKNSTLILGQWLSWWEPECKQVIQSDQPGANAYYAKSALVLNDQAGGHVSLSMYTGSVAPIMKVRAGYEAFDFRTALDTDYVPLNAKAFNVNSQLDSKTDIRPWVNSLDVVKNLPVVSYRPAVGPARVKRVKNKNKNKNEDVNDAPDGVGVLHGDACSPDVCGGTPKKPCADGLRMQTRNVSIIAEDVAKSFSQAASYDDQGNVTGWDVAMMTSLAISAIQELTTQIDDLRAQVANMKPKKSA